MTDVVDGVAPQPSSASSALVLVWLWVESAVLLVADPEVPLEAAEVEGATAALMARALVMAAKAPRLATVTLRRAPRAGWGRRREDRGWGREGLGSMSASCARNL